MEWRIILPLLCLIGILHLPGFAVSQGTTTPSTATTTTTATTVTTTTTPTTAASTTPTTVTTTTTPTTAASTTPTTATTTTTPTTAASTTPTTATTTTTPTTAASTTPTTATTTTTPTTAASTTPTTATTATTTTSGSTTATTTSGSSSTLTGGNSTAATTQSTTAAPPANVGTINLAFKLTDTFKQEYTDLNNAVTKQYVANITSQLNPIYKKLYPNFYRMVVNNLSPGSVNADTKLDFDTTNSSAPNATDVQNTLIQAINNGNITLPIDKLSINATAVSSNGTSTTASSNATTQTTTVATTAEVLANYNITFKIPGNFISDLSNMNSAVAGYLKLFVNNQLSGVFRSVNTFRGVDVWRFRNGSIYIDALYIFAKNINALNVSEVAKQFAAAVRNNTLFLPIDPLSINVTDTLTGATASKSPMLVSMLTALWMTLASLLFSAVMH